MAKKIYTINLPAMYADHHVIEVRRLLMEVPGVSDVYASSGFQVVEIEAEETVEEALLVKILEKAGYIGELPVDAEVEITAAESGGKSKEHRHSSLYEQTRQAVSFTQVVKSNGKALWPCPGMGAIKRIEE